MFGQELQPQYADVLKAFAHSFHQPNEKFVVPFTPKVHVVLQHLEEFVALAGRPLLISATARTSSSTPSTEGKTEFIYLS